MRVGPTAKFCFPVNLQTRFVSSLLTLSLSSMPRSTSKAPSFWFYLAVAVSFAALLIPYFTNSPSTLVLPTALRRHHLAGTLIKIAPSDSQIFAFEAGPRHERSTETVLLLHGLGSSSFSFRHVIRSLSAAGIHSVAIDFPGAGFSDDISAGKYGNLGGFLSWVFDIYREITEKGVFWGFDHLVETGHVPDVHHKPEERTETLSEMLGGVVGQVFDAMSLRKPVHLVVHDSAWGAAVSWVSSNPGSVSSITLMDSSPAVPPAFPYQLLETPVVGGLILKSRSVFGWLVKLCCSRSLNGEEAAAEAYRVLMKDKSVVVAMGKGLNYSFDLGEWARSEWVNELKFQVLWSNTWTDRWIDEGRRIAAAIPQAAFSWHSGGRWPQEDAADEIAELIARFVLSLPSSTEQKEEEALSTEIKSGSNEECGSNHHLHHGLAQVLEG